MSMLDVERLIKLNEEFLKTQEEYIAVSKKFAVCSDEEFRESMKELVCYSNRCDRAKYELFQAVAMIDYDEFMNMSEGDIDRILPILILHHSPFQDSVFNKRTDRYMSDRGKGKKEA